MNTIDHQKQLARLSAKIIANMLRAPGTKTFLFEIAREMIDQWAAKGMIRRKIASPARWIVSKALKPGKSNAGTGISADAGRLLTELARKVNADRAAGPVSDAGTRGEAIDGFLKNTDFGEIREMVEGSDPYILKTIEAINEQLWKYPAKVGTLVATVIPLLNTSMKASREILAPIEKTIGPDMFADIILSVIRGFNGTDAAKLVNTLREIVRRVHTGSLLLGRGGKPLFQIYLTDLLRDFLPELDPELAKKTRITFAEDREAIANAMADALKDNPGITLSYLASMGMVKSLDIKAKARILGVIEKIDPEVLKSSVNESMSDLDTYEIADLLNTACRLANRIHDARADIVSNLVSGVVDSINPEEVRKTASWLIPDFIEAIRPLAGEVMPILLQSLSGLMTSEYGYESPEYAGAAEADRTAPASGGE